MKLARAAVGDRYVLEEMQRIGANLGGEQSGHILFLDDATTGDGMLTAVKIAALIASEGPLDHLVLDLKVYPQTIVNVKVNSKPPLDSLPTVASTLAEAQKTLGDSGRVVLRYSGTEKLARVMVEAEREEDVQRWAHALAGALRSHRRVLPPNSAGVLAGILRPTRNLHLQKHVRRDPAHYIASSFRSRLRPR